MRKVLAVAVLVLAAACAKAEEKADAGEMMEQKIEAAVDTMAAGAAQVVDSAAAAAGQMMDSAAAKMGADSAK